MRRIRPSASPSDHIAVAIDDHILGSAAGQLDDVQRAKLTPLGASAWNWLGGCQRCGRMDGRTIRAEVSCMARALYRTAPLPLPLFACARTRAESQGNAGALCLSMLLERPLGFARGLTASVAAQPEAIVGPAWWVSMCISMGNSPSAASDESKAAQQPEGILGLELEHQRAAVVR